MTRVEVYRNLHTGTWSVRDTRTGRVVAHPNRVAVRDAVFVVRPAGRAKVLAEGRKNVHAFVRGTLAEAPDALPEGAVEAYYNPYRFDSFVDRVTEAPLTSAELVVLDVEDGVHAVAA